MTRNILYLANNAAKKLNVYKSAQAFKLMSGLSETNRCFVTTPVNNINPSKQNDSTANNEITKFMEVYHKIVADIKKSDGNDGVLNEVNQWFTKAMDYTVLHGKMNRGMALIDAYSILNGDRIIDSSSMERVRILGWSLEFMQAFILIIDDIMDNSITRRGQPCWYRNAEVGMIAINDALMIENTCYELVRKHFGNERYFADIINLLHDCVRKTHCGQYLDLLSFHNGVDGKPDLSKYTMQRFSAISKYKTSYYTFCLPIQLAMHISGVSDRESHSIAEQILLKIGEYYQSQDDIIDCFGDPSVTGKVGTDISEGKCCWPVVTALHRANRQQYRLIEENYGINDSVAVKNVKRLYREMNIENEYKPYAEKSYTEICNDIESIDKSSKLSADVFYSALNKIHKRQK